MMAAANTTTYLDPGGRKRKRPRGREGVVVVVLVVHMTTRPRGSKLADEEEEGVVG